VRSFVIVIAFLLVGFLGKSQIDGNLLLGLTNVTDNELETIVNAPIGSLAYNTTKNALVTFSGSSWTETLSSGVGWNINGNNNVDSNTEFLGTINDVKMEIRSNNLPMLQFGRRQTLGLLQNYPDYKDDDQPMVHINGDGTTSALQFAAAGASFYKPMFFTTDNGSFRLKGSTGITDLFEIGSAGPNNDGRLEFIIGDDGAEPIVFKRYDYRSGQFHTELFRVQGSTNQQNAKPRFGININPQQVPVDPEYDDPTSSFNMANSTFQVNGSVSNSIMTTTGSTTLTEEHHTIILGGNHSITLPNANSCKGRIYIIKNTSSSWRSISSYRNEWGGSDTRIDGRKILWLQSDGTNWQQIK
jgi:hypothetical protein